MLDKDEALYGHLDIKLEHVRMLAKLYIFDIEPYPEEEAEL